MCSLWLVSTYHGVEKCESVKYQHMELESVQFVGCINISWSRKVCNLWVVLTYGVGKCAILWVVSTYHGVGKCAVYGCYALLCPVLNIISISRSPVEITF